MNKYKFRYTSDDNYSFEILTSKGLSFYLYLHKYGKTKRIRKKAKSYLNKSNKVEELIITNLLKSEYDFCEYCRCSDYGIEDYHGEIIPTPYGYDWCEGSCCEEAQQNYLKSIREIIY